MKIHGPNQTNFNPYKNQVPRQQKGTAGIGKEDQLQISSEAQKMLVKQQPNAERTARIEEIKDAVASGNYKIDFQKIAGKMIDFFKKPQ